MSDEQQPLNLEDPQLDSALIEYANTMSDTDRVAFMDQLQNDPSFYQTMGDALSEMAMLIAGAAVIDDEPEYNKMRRHIMNNARHDTPAIKTMRLFYLNNRHTVDMAAVINGEAEEKRFDSRLASFLQDYLQSHPA